MQYLTIIESASGMIQKKCQSISKSFQLQFSKLLPLERVLNLCALGQPHSSINRDVVLNAEWKEQMKW